MIWSVALRVLSSRTGQAIVLVVLAIGAIYAHGKVQYNKGRDDLTAEILAETSRRVDSGQEAAEIVRTEIAEGKSPLEIIRANGGRWK